VTAVPAETPRSRFKTLGPMFVTVVAPRTENDYAVPSPGAVVTKRVACGGAAEGVALGMQARGVRARTANDNETKDERAMKAAFFYRDVSNRNRVDRS